VNTPIHDDGLNELVRYTGSQGETYEALAAEMAGERASLGRTEMEDRDSGDYVDVKLLRRIDAFVDAIPQFSGPAFYIDAERGKPKLKRGELGKYFGLLQHFHSPKIRLGYGERAKLFYEALEELALDDSAALSPWSADLNGEPIWKAFNELVEVMRERILRGSFREAMRRAYEMSRHQEQLLNEHLVEVFAVCTVLRVVRVDFALQGEVHGEAAAQEALAELRRQFGRFLNNRRHNKLFKHLISYAWKLELSRRDGVHYHVLFYFDGSEVRADAYIASLIGEYWLRLVGKDKARFYTSNYAAGNKNFHELAIGKVSYDDERSVTALRNLFTYFAKPEQRVRAIAATERAMGVGAVRARKSNAGRKRGKVAVLPGMLR